MRTPGIAGLRLATAALVLGLPCVAQEFSHDIRPLLVENCAACHNPANPDPRGPANFLKATEAQDIQQDRGLWRSVAAQLRNRTMPPGDAKLSEDSRLQISQWIEKELVQTACSVDAYAGAAAVRRLNRREYHSTVRDLLGVSLEVADTAPAERVSTRTARRCTFRRCCWRATCKRHSGYWTT